MKRKVLYSVTLIGVAMLILITLLVYVKYYPGKQQPGELRLLKVGLSWVHEAQFAGLYWADQKGFYEKEGLAVELIPYQPDEDLAQELVDGKYDFVIMQTDTLLQAREKGLKIKALFADYRLMPTCYFSKKKANITKPEDLVGKTVGVAYSERYPLVAMLMNKGINPGEVNIVDREYSYKALADDTFDVEAGWITDGISVESAIGAYNVIHPYNYGINWYADLIVTSEEMIKKESKLVEAFIRMTAKGWEKAMENLDEAALLTQKYDPDIDAEHLKFVLRVSSSLICVGDRYIGWMEGFVFQQAQDSLLNQGIIQKPLSIDELYTLEFLNKVYGQGERAEKENL